MHQALRYMRSLQLVCRMLTVRMPISPAVIFAVANDMEDQRLSVDVRVPERGAQGYGLPERCFADEFPMCQALREVYLMPFHIAQKRSKPWSYMTSYSRVNGQHGRRDCGSLLRQIVRL